MAWILKTIKVIAAVGDKIKAPGSIFRDDLDLYICHIDGDLLYISTEKGDTKENCECAFATDCYLV